MISSDISLTIMSVAEIYTPVFNKLRLEKYIYIYLLSSHRENKRRNMKTKDKYICIYFSSRNFFENRCIQMLNYIYKYIQILKMYPYRDTVSRKLLGPPST